MERKDKGNFQNNAVFLQIVKDAYEKGVNESEITLEKLIEDIKTDLKQLVLS